MFNIFNCYLSNCYFPFICYDRSQNSQYTPIIIYVELTSI